MRVIQTLLMMPLAAVVVGCGSSSGGDKPSGGNTTPTAPSAAAATASLSVDRNDVAPGAPIVVTWSSTNATSCTASGVWTGARATSGTATINLAASGSVNLSCVGTGAAGTASAAVTTIAATFALPRGVNKWRSSVGDLDGDGDYELLLPTLDSAGLYVATPATPVFVLSVVNQRVVDKTPTLFPGGAATTFAGRVFIGDFDGNGKMDLQTCDRGKDPGRGSTVLQNNTPNLVNGINVAQASVYLQGADGKFTKANSFPQVLQDGWGCSSGDIDKSGRSSIVQSTWTAQQGFPASWTAKWNGAAFVKTRDLLPQFPNATQPNTTTFGWTETADFDGNGYADIYGVSTMFWGDASGGQFLARLPSALELAGYTFHRGSLAADFNKDGFQDLVIQTSKTPSAAGGGEGEARFTLYLGGANRSLTERVGGFPSIGTYNGSDFGNEINAIDINFDGFDDIVTTGHVYAFQGTDREPRAVWINNGDGTFKLQHVSDELEGYFNCPNGQGGPLKYYEAYYLKTKDPKAFNYINTGCSTFPAPPGAGGPPYVARRVTPQYPLKIVP